MISFTIGRTEMVDISDFDNLAYVIIRSFSNFSQGTGTFGRLILATFARLDGGGLREGQENEKKNM